MKMRLGRNPIVLGALRRVGKILLRIAKPIYKLYELILWTQICCGPIPKHVAIIPDGNRRWARLYGLDSKYGHSMGYEKLKEVLNWIWDLGVKVITIYAMSYENCLKRPKDEREHLLNLLSKAIDEFLSNGEIDRKKVRVKFFGRFNLIPDEIINKMRKLEEYSSKYKDRYLNIAVCYGGRQEIIDAVNKIIEDFKKGKISSRLDENTFRKYLGISHLVNEEGLEEPDLVIRTSGELRISNFLLWQIAYSELYFCDVYWPDFRKIDLWRAIRSYQKRERRFGK